MCAGPGQDQDGTQRLLVVNGARFLSADFCRIFAHGIPDCVVRAGQARTIPR